MTPELWNEVSDCLDRLMDLDPDAATDFLAALRATRPAVCAEVESLWDQDTVSEDFDTPPAPLLSDVSALLGGGTGPNRVLPAETVGRYELRAEIARGGMGAVFEAFDPAFDRALAIKLLLPDLRHHPEAQARFLREARITGRLQHPGIPPVHEVGRFPDGTPYFALKLIRGRTLAEKLRDAKPERGEAVATFEQICHTLAYAHSQSTIHRDLKPGNVMVGAFGEVQVMDWGLARELAPLSRRGRGGEGDSSALAPIPPHPCPPPPAGEGFQSDLTEAGDIRGTPAYMAPEQALGDPAELDERCDVFGLGGILVAILTQEPTFTGTGEAMLRQAQAGDVSAALRRVEAEGIDDELLAIVRRCLAPAKEDRYRDAGALAQAVTAYRESARRQLEQAELARQMALTQAREERRRRRITLVLGAALLLVVSAGLGVAIWLGLLAEERRESAVAAERQVSQEKDRTEETAKQARKAIQDNFILATENPEFKKPGMQAARQLLLDRALTFYREFSELRKDDAALQEEVADAHQRIGYILAERGEHRNALAEYERAIAIHEKLSAARPDERRFRMAVVGAIRSKADEEEKLGDHSAAAASLRTARDWLSPVLRGDPENPELIHLDVQLLNSLGGHEYETGRLDESLKHFQDALEKVTDLYERRNLRTEGVVSSATRSLVTIGHVLNDQRKPAEALSYYQRAKKPLEDLHQNYPTPFSLASLARVYASMALVQESLGRTDDEVRSHRTAIEYRERLVRENPLVPDYRSELTKSYFNLASTLQTVAEEKGTTDPESRKLLEKGLEVGAPLVERPADKVVYYHHVAVVRIGLAQRLRRDDKNYAAARAQLTEANKLLDEIERRKAVTPLFRAARADWEQEAGMVAAFLGEHPEALAHYRNAIDIRRQLIAQGLLLAAKHRLEIGRIRMSEAYVLVTCGQFDAGLRAQFQGVEELAALVKESPRDDGFRGSHERAVDNMRQIAREALNKTLPFPKNNTVANVVQYHEERIARLQAWHRTYPTVEPFRDEIAREAVGIAGNYGLLLNPEKTFDAATRADLLAEVEKALTRAREYGLTDAKLLEANVGLVHYRKLPEYQRFVSTLK